MKKGILKRVGNDGYRFCYEVDKKEEFKEIFLSFMKELGFKERDFNYIFELPDKEGEVVELKIKEINQRVDNFRNNDFDVDVIYWRNKIEMIVRTKKKEKLIKQIGKYFKFFGEK